MEPGFWRMGIVQRKVRSVTERLVDVGARAGHLVEIDISTKSREQHPRYSSIARIVTLGDVLDVSPSAIRTGAPTDGLGVADSLERAFGFAEQRDWRRSGVGKFAKDCIFCKPGIQRRTYKCFDPPPI